MMIWTTKSEIFLIFLILLASSLLMIQKCWFF